MTNNETNDNKGCCNLDKIEEKVEEGIDTAVEFAKDINEKYDVEGKVKEGIETATEFAKDVNEKYDVEEKVKQGVDTAVEFAKETKEKYDNASDETKTKIKKGVFGAIAVWLGFKTAKKIIKKDD